MVLFRQLIPNYAVYSIYLILLAFMTFLPYFIISKYKIYTLFMAVNSVILLLVSLVLMYSTAFLTSPYVLGFILAVIIYAVISSYMVKKYNANLIINKYEILQSVFMVGYVIVNIITLLQNEKYTLLTNILSYALLIGLFLSLSYEKKLLK